MPPLSERKTRRKRADRRRQAEKFPVESSERRQGRIIDGNN